MADLFGGSGAVARACRRQGVPARGWELEAGPQYDLTCCRVRGKIASETRAGKIIGSMLAPPCASWGPAGNRSFPVRTSERPWGKPDEELTEKQHARVALGNATMRAALILIRLFDRLRIPWILEHPHASFCFKTVEMIAIMKWPRVVEVVPDQCRFGTPWRKRTRLLCGNIDEQDLTRLRLRCTGSGGLCGSGKRHVVLQGATGGRAMTSIAQAYPTRLGTALAHALTNRARAGLYNGG